MTAYTRIASLPDPIRYEDGWQVENSTDWAGQRRGELLTLFREHVFGRAPVGRPPGMRIRVASETPMMDGKAIRKRIFISYEGPGGSGELPFTLFLPADAPNPVPAFVLVNNRGLEAADPDRVTRSGFWPVEEIVARGYATAAFQVEDVDPDEHDGFHNGVHGLFDPPGESRAPDAWATIAAWAWGASRVMDALEQEPAVDATRVALVGHSRGGKTSLWAGAEDERFAMVVSNDSGCTGAAISRGKKGERISNINTLFPYWFAENYKQYNDREEALPVDQHELLAMIAPRLLYVSSATEDEWADPDSEFLALQAVEPVYRLWGDAGLGTDAMPPADTPVFGERTGYHIRTGGHDLTAFDWQCFLDFAEGRL